MCPHGHHLGADDEGEFVAKNQLKSPTMWLHAFQSDQQRDVRTKPHQLHSSLQTCQETTSKAFIASNYVQLSEPTHFFASVDPKNASIEWSPPISASTATILKYTNKHLKRRSSDLSEKIASLTLSPPSDVSSSYSATSTKTESADQMCPPAPPPSPSTGRCIFNSSSPVRAGVDAKAVGAASTTTSFKSETDGFNTTPRARPHGHGLAQKNINKTKKRYKIGHAEYESIAAAVEYIMCQEGDAAAGNEDTFRKGRFTVTPILLRSHFDLSAADFISFKTEKRFEILVPRTEPQIHTSMTHVHPHSNAAAVPAAAARTAPHSMFETPLATRPASSGSRNQRHRTHSQHSQHKHKLPVKAAPESCRNKAAGRSAKKHHPRDNLYQNKHSLQKRNSANKHINSTSSSATSTTGKRTSSHARKLKWADKQALEAAIRRSRRATSLGASAAPSSEPHLDLARDSLHLLMREAFATCPPEGPISREDLLFHDSFYRGAGELQSYGPADSYTPYCQSFHAPPSPNVPKVPSTMQERHEYSYDSDDLDADQYMSDCSSSDSSSRSLNHKEDDVDEFDLGREIDEACNDLDLTPSDEEDQEDMNGPKSPPFNFGSTPVYMDPYASFDLNDASSPPPYLFSFPRCLSLSLSFRLASLACTFSPFRARD